MRKLSPREKLFAAAVVRFNGNASAAARELGASDERAGATGARMMARPRVAEEVSRLVARAMERYEITAARVLQEVAFGAFSRPGAYFDEDGETVTPPAQWPEHVAAAVASFEVVERPVAGRFVDDETMASGRRWVEPTIERRYRVKLVDKTAHLTLLMRNLALLTDRKQVEVKHTLETIIGQSMKHVRAAAAPLTIEATGTPLEPPQAGGSRSRALPTGQTSPHDVQLFD